MKSGLRNVVSFFLAVCLAQIAAMTASAATYVYQTDFESGIGPEWSNTISWDNSFPGTFTAFTGRYSNSAQTLTLNGLTAGTDYTVVFDLYVIDTWDGNNTSYGPDTIIVEADGTEKFHYTFSNYNGDPPNEAQTYPGQPDSGRVNLGFAGYVDAIYRNLQVTFTAAATTAAVTFRGANLQDIGDESWGLDNVRVAKAGQLSSEIEATSLPAEGTSRERAYDSFSITSFLTLEASTASSASNYSLREAGPNHTFGDGDDVVWTIAPSFAAGRTVNFSITGGPLQAGKYQFTATGLKDSSNGDVKPYTLTFTITDPVLGKIENTSNDTLAEATPLPVTESPAGSGLFTAGAIGTFDRVGDVDYYRFDAETGDLISIRLDAENGGTYPQIYFQDSAGNNYVTFGGEYQRARIFNFRVPAPGTYYLRVFSNNNRSPYRMRLMQTRSLQGEVEDNNSTPGNDLALTFTAGNYSGRIMGAFDVDDAAGDFFRLGVLNVGNSMAISLATPAGSTITTADTTIELLLEGDATPVATSSSGTLNFTVTQSGAYYLHLNTAKRETRAEYLLSLAVTDGVPPTIATDSLPDEGTTVNTLINGFTVNFSEDLLQATAVDSTNYELRGAGADNTFGTADDALYTLAVGYTSGLTASFGITDGPLAPGKIRFTVKTGIKDRSENALAAPYVRQFTVQGVDGFIASSRGNADFKKATPLSQPGTHGDGSFTPYWNSGSGGHPWGIAKGDFDGDGKLDVVVANYDQSTLAFFHGNGDGTFSTTPTVMGGVGNPNGMAAADLNGDGKLDLVVANRAGSVIVLLGKGDGTFNDPVGLAPAGSPWDVALVDVNGDGKLDIVSPMINAGVVSVFLGGGDGTFSARADFAAGNGPISIVTGDVNGDGKIDLVTANNSGNDITVLTGNGDGTFNAPAHYPTGVTPRWIAKADFNGDGRMDVVVTSASDNTYTVLTGNADGSFQSLGNKGANTGDPYHVIAADFNGDGKMDFAISSYGQARLRVYLGRGDGLFDEGMDTSFPGNPIVSVAGDFNGDGIEDVAVGLHAGNQLGMLLGNPALEIPADASFPGVRTAWVRGSLATFDDVEYFAFTAHKGERLIIASQTPGAIGNSGLYYQLTISDAEVWWGFGADGIGAGQNNTFVVPYDGRFLVRVSRYNNYTGEYRFRVTLASPPILTEDEYNGDFNNANRLPLTLAGHTQSAKVLGYYSTQDNGDFYNLGQIATGAAIHLSLTKPSSSALVPLLEIFSGGALVASGGSGVATLDYTLPADGNNAYYARVRNDGGGDYANQYLLSIDVANTVAPVITSVTLPSEGSSSVFVSPYFSIGFNEDMLATTVTDNSNYDLRAAGPDGAFDTADDVLYTVNNQGYGSGLSTGFFVSDGPMQPGSYRFTIQTGVMDRFGFGIAQPYVRKFAIAEEPGYPLENRNNGSPRTATPLAQVTGSLPDGSFIVLDNTPGSAANPWAIAVGDLNGDGKLDAVVGDYYESVLSIYIGDGTGKFTRTAGLAPGNNPRGLALADFNGDGKLDIVSANWGLNSVGILVGNGDGTFQPVVQVPVGVTASCVAVADLNGDGEKDLVVGNWSSSTVSVLIGNGDATFAPAVSLPAGSNPLSIAAKDLNGDGRADIIVGNYGNSTVGVYINNGDGTFGDMVSYNVAGSVRSLDTADFNGDGKLDVALITAQNQFQRLLNNGDGTLGTPVSFSVSLSETYHMIAGDFNLDGKADVAIANYGNSRVELLFGQGDGTFNNSSYYFVPGNPIVIATGDVNGDGRPDFLTGNHQGRSLGTLIANGQRLLTEDPPGSGFRTSTARGNNDNGADYDYFSFSANAGDTVTVACETDNSANSGLYYEIMNQNGDVLTGFPAVNRGWGQSAPVKLGSPGTYFVRVRWYNQYTGEYRIRVSLAPDPVQMEAENNNGVGNAQTLAYATGPGKQAATVAGTISMGDDQNNVGYDQDIYRLGNLSSGTLVKLTATQPTTSGLSAVLDVLDGSGTAVATSAPGGSLNYTVPDGADGSYVARVRSVGPSRTSDAGPYLFFNSGSQYVNTGAWAPSRNWTVEAWVRPEVLWGGRRGILGSWSSCQDWGLVQLDGQLGLSFKRPNGCGDVITAGALPKFGEWVHVAGTSDGTTASLYINGNLVNTGPIGPEFAPTTAGAWIGGEPCCGNWFYGFVDDAAIWNRALTSDEIKTTMTGTLLGTEPDLMGYWRFEEGSGTTVADSTGNHDGNALNNPAWLDVGPTTARGPNLMAQYILNIQMEDSKPPTIVSVSLPDEGSEATFVPPGFSIGFSEDMTAATVNNADNYELRSAGAY